MSGEKYFLFGILLPAFPFGCVACVFEGGNLCYAQLMNGNEIAQGTGMLIFSPKLIFGNPLVKAIPKIGEAISKASEMTTYVAIGLSLPTSGGPKMEMEFSNEFWGCDGGCKTLDGHVYVAIKLDLTESTAKKMKLGPFSLAFEAKFMMNFDPEGDGFLNEISLVNDIINGGPTNLVSPETALDFLEDVLALDISVGIDGKLTLGIPLGEWSHGLFRDLDITLGAASARFDKKNGYAALYMNLKTGGHANENLMDDIQSKILDKFQTNEVKAIVGLIGKGVGAVVNAWQSTGMSFDLFIKGSCSGSIMSDGVSCSSIEFGVKFAASLFEVAVQYKDDKFTFCFAIKHIFDSCDGGFKNFIVLLQKAGEMVVYLAESAAQAISAGVEWVADKVCELSEAALQQGKIVFDHVSAGAVAAAQEVGEWAAGAASDTVEFTADAAEEIGGHVDAAGNFVAGAAVGTVHAVGDAAEATFGLAYYYYYTFQAVGGAAEVVGGGVVTGAETVGNGVVDAGEAVVETFNPSNWG